MSIALDLKTLLNNIDSQLADVTDRAAIAAREAAANREEARRYILVRIGGVHLAISIEDMAEVGPLPPVTFLPNLPAWIQGIVNIRSEIVSVIDFNGFLKVPGQPPCDGSRLVVLRHKKTKIGMRIDRIVGTVARVDSERKPLPPGSGKSLDASLFASGLQVDEGFYHILNVRKMLTSSRLIDYGRRG